nr:MAG TPA: hypothetical protein [Caudoviricetes sp.]
MGAGAGEIYVGADRAICVAARRYSQRKLAGCADYGAR